VLHGNLCIFIGGKCFGGMYFEERLMGGKPAEERENL
jgi:hypothetical protein